jgi:hypothetical protein
MQFNLPENLKNSIVAYDPILKKEVAERKRVQKTTTAYDKPKNPLGLPVDIIPETIVDRKELLIDLEAINSVPVENRVFVRTNYIIYHYESVWYAIWFLPRNAKSDTYLYGYSTAFKNTTKLRADKERLLNTSSQIIKYGRSEFNVTINYETIETLLEKKDKRSYIELGVNVSWKKGGVIRKSYATFMDKIEARFDTWYNRSQYTMFDKIRDKASYTHLLIDSREYITDKANLDFFTWKPTFEGIVAYLEAKDYEENAAVIKILNKPFFKKKFESLQGEIDAILNSNDEEVKRDGAKEPWERKMRLVKNIRAIERMWPGCPVDYYQTHFEVLEKIRHLSWSNRPLANAWLNCNMPVATFFNFLGKYKEQVDNFGSYKTLDYNLWTDTYSMLGNITNNEESKLAQPKRWRLQEFHDYLQEESWKLDTKNEVLPQDLFPTPITVSSQEKWTFFQPRDIHQLSSWGRAVRNCIGSASSYSEGVKKKQHFIVLAMIDNAPTFTIQLKVENGRMNVVQIVSICNKRLTDEEKDKYTSMFGAALEKRDQELVK